MGLQHREPELAALYPAIAAHVVDDQIRENYCLESVSHKWPAVKFVLLVFYASIIYGVSGLLAWTSSITT